MEVFLSSMHMCDDLLASTMAPASADAAAIPAGVLAAAAPAVSATVPATALATAPAAETFTFASTCPPCTYEEVIPSSAFLTVEEALACPAFASFAAPLSEEPPESVLALYLLFLRSRCACGTNGNFCDSGAGVRGEIEIAGYEGGDGAGGSRKRKRQPEEVEGVEGEQKGQEGREKECQQGPLKCVCSKSTLLRCLPPSMDHFDALLCWR